MMRQILRCGVGATACFVQLAWGSAVAQTPPPQTPPPSQALIPNTTSADPSDVAVEDIVVTAQRRSENLQTVPISVSAVTASRLATVGVTTTQELAVVTPGLNVPQTAGYIQPHIRGVGSSTSGAGLEQPVATYIDGVYLASASSSLLTLNNIERIEVLKGPQGTLFGRNATGGLIQIVTKDPNHVSHAIASLTYANYNDITGDFYGTAGLTDSLAADIALRYEEQGDGWGRNLGTGREVGKLDHDFAGRMKFLFEPDASSQIRVSFDYSDRTSTRDVQHISNGYPTSFNNAFFGGPYPQGGYYDVNFDNDDKSSLKTGGVGLQVDHEFAFGNLKTITAFRASSFAFMLDTDLTPRPLLTIAPSSRDDQFSQEVQLASRKGSVINWVAGVYYYFANDRWQPISVDFGASPISPVPNVTVSDVIRDRQLTNSIAIYGQATTAVLRRLNLTLGGRFTHETKEVSGSEDFVVGGRVASTFPVPTPGLGIPDHVRFDRFNYRISLDYKLSSRVLAYVSYNTGFKSGGYNLTVASNPPYNPESIKALEGGVKSELFDRHVRLNVAGFLNEYRNIQVGRYINATEALYNGAKARIYGFDLDGEIVVDRHLSLNGGFSYLHARFTSFPDADFFSPVGGCVPVGGATCSGSAEGKGLPFSPDTSFNLGADYKHELAGGRLAIDANYFRTARFFAAPDNVTQQAAYDLINVSVGWTDRHERYSIRLWGKNLGATRYATSLVEANQGPIESRGAPRTYGVTLGARF